MRFSFTPKDIGRLIKQRLFWFAIPFALIAMIGLAVIGQLPPLYESRAFMIVQSQQVPDDFVQTTITAQAEERLRTVQAEVMARDNIIRIGDRFDVFRGERLSRTEKSDIMRSRASIAVRQEADRRASRNAAAIVTTTISFRDEDPQKAQQVANALTNEFQTGVIEIRRDQAGGTTDFLLEEERKVRRSLQALAERIAAIKQENPSSLPDNRSLYESTLSRLLIDRSRVDSSIEQTATDIQQLKMQRPLFSSSDLSPREQELANLRSALTTARGRYTETYPGVISLKRQVLDLEREVDPDAFRRNARSEIEELGRQLTDLRKGTPDYDETESRIAELRGQLDALPAGSGDASPGEVSFAGQLFALESREQMLARQKEDLERQITDMESRIAALPAIEGQLGSLIEEQGRLERDLAGVQAKRAAAERAESVEVQAMAERMLMIDQPSVPDEPASPDKPKLALAVFALAGGLAGLLVLIPEILFAKVQTRDHLAELLPDVPIVEVPRFKTADERLPKLVATASLTAATLVLGVALSWTAYQTLA